MARTPKMRFFMRCAGTYGYPRACVTYMGERRYFTYPFPVDKKLFVYLNTDGTLKTPNTTQNEDNEKARALSAALLQFKKNTLRGVNALIKAGLFNDFSSRYTEHAALILRVYKDEPEKMTEKLDELRQWQREDTERATKRREAQEAKQISKAEESEE